MNEQEMREKVTKGLGCCEKKVCIFKDTEKECPYWELCGEYESAFEDCTTALAKDALALLKAQEAKPISASIVDSDGGLMHWWACGNCQAPINPEDKFCHECGKPVKWE